MFEFIRIIGFYIVFVTTIFVAFYIPGRVVLSRTSIKNSLTVIALSFVIGFVMWGWQGFISGYLHLRFLSYAYLLIFIFLYIRYKLYKFDFNKKSIRFTKMDWIAVGIVLLGTIFHNAHYVLTGTITPQGLMQPLYNNSDHFWHTSMIAEMSDRFPPHEPGMYGILKTNYHYWFNLITAELVRVFHIPLFKTQYMGMYIFGSIMLGVVAYALAATIKPMKSFGRLLLILLYFGSDAVYFVSLVKTGTPILNAPSLIEKGSLFMDNPPRAFSVLVAFCALILVFRYIKKFSVTESIIMVLLLGTLVGFKVYTGIILLLAFGCLTFLHILKKRYEGIVLCLASGILSAIIFFPVNANSGGIFFLPFERPRDFVTYKPFGFYELELKWRTYLEHKNYPRLFQIGTYMTGMYLLYQFGNKLIGLIPYKKTLTTLGLEGSVFIYSGIAASFIIGTLFSQRSHVSDSFNFYLPGSLLLLIPASLTIALFIQSKPRIIKAIVLGVFLALLIPRCIHDINMFFYRKSLGNPMISHQELQSFTFLKENTPTDSLILVINNGHLDSTSAVVSIFSDRNMFLSGQGVIKAHNAMNPERERVVAQIQKSKNSKIVNQLLKRYGIDYVYFYGKPNLATPLTKLKLKKVYETNFAVIYKRE